MVRIGQIQQDGAAGVFEVYVLAVHIGNHGAGEFGLIGAGVAAAGGDNLGRDAGHSSFHGSGSRYGNLEVLGSLRIEVRGGHGDRNIGFAFGHTGDNTLVVYGSDGSVLRDEGQGAVRVASHFSRGGPAHCDGLVLRGDDSGGGLLGEGDHLVGGFADHGEGSSALRGVAGVHVEGNFDGFAVLALGEGGNPLVVVTDAPEIL